MTILNAFWFVVLEPMFFCAKDSADNIIIVVAWLYREMGVKALVYYYI